MPNEHIRSDADERLAFARQNPPGPRHARIIQAIEGAPSPVVAAVSQRLEALDKADALDSIEAWIVKNPGARSVWVMDRLHGQWRVGLSVDCDRLSAGVGRTLSQAVATALQIADLAGWL